jgi:lysophospholipase L1-like esterase
MFGHEKAQEGTKKEGRDARLRVLAYEKAAIGIFVTFCAFSWLSIVDQQTCLAREANESPFAAEIAAFEKWDRQNAVPRDGILFVGSSSIRLWQTAESFPDLPVINRGFGGSTIADVNRYADRIVLKYRPRTIVFYAGDNDIAGGKSPIDVTRDFTVFVKHVARELPETKIIYLSIKPSPSRAKLWPKAKQVNSSIKGFMESRPRCAYVDIATPMLGDDGKPRQELFLDDDLHMNDAGYKIWNEVLCSHLDSSVSPR